MTKKTPLLILLLYLFYNSSLSYAETGKTSTLCYEDQDYPPYLIGDSDLPVSPNPGLLVELSKMAFEKAGMEVIYIRRPWKRCMRLVQDNHVDGMFGVIYIPEREKIGKYPKKDGAIDVSKRLLNVDYPVFVNQNSRANWDGTKFSTTRIKIGTPLGYATVKALNEEQGIEPNTSYLPEKGLELVSQEKMDAYIVEKNVGLSILRKLNLTETVQIQGPPFKRHNLYLLLSHNFYETNEEKAEEIWSHLAKLRKTVLDGMMKKYMNEQ